MVSAELTDVIWWDVLPQLIEKVVNKIINIALAILMFPFFNMFISQLPPIMKGYLRWPQKT
jgi:hypothetical protein